MTNIIGTDSLHKSNTSGQPEEFLQTPSANNIQTKRVEQERVLLNLFEPKHIETLQKADIKQHLNGNTPKELISILSPFLPLYTKKQICAPKLKGLSRYQRKIANKQSYEKTITSHVDAFKKLLSQVTSDIRDKNTTSLDAASSPVDFSEARHIKEENKVRLKNENERRADFYRQMRHLGIPKKIFFSAPIEQLEELATQYTTHTESTVTMKNYTHDIMKHVILPAYEKRTTSTFSHQNEVYQKLVDLCYKVCFSHKNREGNLHPHILTLYVVEGDEPGLKISDIRGALSEAYGKYILENLHTYVSDVAFQCTPLSMNDTTRRVLDLHAKSDAVYKISTPDNVEMIWSVDFKNRGDRKEAGETYSSLDVDSDQVTTHIYDRTDLTHKLRRNLRTDETIPVKGILLYMGLPKSFLDMHFTPSMIQTDAHYFYNQLLQASAISTSQVQ